MKLEFFPAAPGLNRHVSVYYRMRVDYLLIEDVERADVGYLRFFLKGTGSIQYVSGARDPDQKVMIMGPATETGRYILNGPLDCFGCVLLPDFWGGLVDVDATVCANRGLDGCLFLGADADAHYAKLQGLQTIEQMAKATDAWLMRKVKPLGEDQIEAIDRIGDWLRCFPIPSPDQLYASLSKSSRQILRLSNRHFGAPPKLLARKFRALRTASRLVGTRGEIPKELIAEYSDQAHLSREVKHFTGLTARQLQINSNPIVLATLHPDNFRADAPWM